MPRKMRIGAALFAALLLGTFVWLRIATKNRMDFDRPAEDNSVAAGMQTPPSSTGGGEEDSDEDPSYDSEETKDEAKSGAPAGGSESPYRFESWEDAADLLAEMVAEQYDALLLNPPKPYNSPIAMAAPAYRNVMDSIYEHGELPALREALKPFLPITGIADADQPPHRMPKSEFDGVALLVRASRLPASIMNPPIRLPN